ncbi:hypothetical protein [uncultured Tessaracoccus sp.]|uniref:hypothetical protein n=1 Tax=uncultured Tessaracoccus sp. TaxID=905023 RepID=UPI0026050C5E|nr:hypothetical protein [uncultured Tessaracoccus sp.]
MVKQRRLGYAIATTLLLATLTACQPAQPEAQEQPTPAAPTSIRRAPTPSPTPSPIPTPSPTAHESFPPPEPGEPAEITAVRKGWEEHETQWDRYAKDSSLTDLTPLVLTTTGQRELDAVDALGDWRDAGRVRVGNVSFRNVLITTPQRNSDGVNVATLTACKDFTHQKDIVEKTGTTADPGQGHQWEPTVEVSIIMQQHLDGRWVVADAQGKPKQC